MHYFMRLFNHSMLFLGEKRKSLRQH